MKRAIAVLAAVLSAASARPAPALVIDPCTIVAVQMMDNVSSGEARPGDFFRFETVNAVTSGAKVVIPARTMGEGIVSVAAPAGRNARPGTLVLEPRYLMLPNGHHLEVVLNHNTSGLVENGRSDALPGYLGVLPVPGVGLAIAGFNYFRKGKDIVIPRGTIFSVFPSDEPAVERCQEHPSY